MQEIRAYIKDLSDFLPIIIILAGALSAYFQYRVKKIIDKDIKGVSLKINYVGQVYDKKLEALKVKFDLHKDKMNDNHTALSNSLSRIEGALGTYTAFKKTSEERS